MKDPLDPILGLAVAAILSLPVWAVILWVFV